MRKKISGWDFWGVLISGLCLLHCIGIPLVLLFMPAFGRRIFPSEDLTHVVLLAFILGVAGIAFVTGYRVHGKWKPVVWLVAGLGLVSYATFFAHAQLGHAWEPVIAIIGSLCLIRAHYLNHHCKKCEKAHSHHMGS